MTKVFLIIPILLLVMFLVVCFTNWAISREDKKEFRRGEVRKRNATIEAERQQLMEEIQRLTALKDEIKADAQNHITVVGDDVFAHRVQDAIRKVE